MNKSRTIRWILLIVARRRGWAISAGSDFTARTRRPRPTMRKSRRRNAGSRHHRTGREGRFSGLSDRARNRSGLQHRPGAHPRRRPDRQDRLQGRPAGQPGRPAGRDRSPAVPGDARSGQGQEGAGRGQSGQRQSGSAALHQARRIRDPAADRHPALHRCAIDRADRGRRCGHLQRPDPARLHRRSRRRSPASSACVRSTSATSSMPRPRPASSRSPRSSRSPSFSPRRKSNCPI